MSGKMRAVVISELAPDYGGVAVREIDRPPAPEPGEVVIRTRAASVNFPDLLQTEGKYQHKPDLPFTGGMEAAGEVVAAGEGSDFSEGDRVVGSARFQTAGAFAEFCRLTNPRAIPPSMGFSEAAAFGLAYMTAWVSLVPRGELKPGEWVLVHGASGGVGLAAVDLAKALDARVIATGASDAKLKIVDAAYQPDAVLNVTGGFREQVKEIVQGRGADVIYDPVGGDVFDESVRCIAPEGRLLTIGFASGRIPTLPVNMALIKTFSLIGVRAGEWARAHPEDAKMAQDTLWRMAGEGKLNPRVHAEYALGDWRAAYDSLANREVVGKAIIRPDL